jgi:hypothetical protein
VALLSKQDAQALDSKVHYSVRLVDLLELAELTALEGRYHLLDFGQDLLDEF